MGDLPKEFNPKQYWLLGVRGWTVSPSCATSLQCGTTAFPALASSLLKWRFHRCLPFLHRAMQAPLPQVASQDRGAGSDRVCFMGPLVWHTIQLPTTDPQRSFTTFVEKPGFPYTMTSSVLWQVGKELVIFHLLNVNSFCSIKLFRTSKIHQNRVTTARNYSQRESGRFLKKVWLLKGKCTCIKAVIKLAKKIKWVQFISRSYRFLLGN